MIAEGPFGCWQEGIVANFDYLVRNFGCPQTMHDCPGYCVGDGTMPTVDAVQAAIKNGLQGKILEVEDNDQDERVEIFVE